MILLTIDSVVCEPIDDQTVELACDSQTTIDPEAGRSGTSLTLELLSTETTDKVFGPEKYLYGAGTFNATTHTAILQVDGVDLLAGSLRLLSVIRQGSECRYRVELRSGAYQWAKLAARKRLHELDIEYAGQLLPATIAASWTNNSPVRFFPVLHDSYEIRTGSIGIDVPERILTTDDYHPFLSIYEMLQALFRQAGYTVESDFFEGDLFRSLYMSGAYASHDTRAREQKMGFFARRKADSSTTASSLGRVDANPFLAFNSVGNFVDAFSPQEVDQDGATLTDAYSAGGCLRMEEGELCFRPLTEVNVGFEYHIRYITDYRIRSRTRLTGMDSIWFGVDADVHYELANRFQDRREAPQGGYEYRIVVFDHTDNDGWALKGSVDGTLTEIAAFPSRSLLVTMPEAQQITDLQLYRNGEDTPYTGDWALYDGYIGETGQTEVELTVCTSPERITPTAPKYFRQLYFYGADPGMNFTLSHECTLRPRFSSVPGYGAQLSFADVARHAIQQIDVLQALAHLFNLRFLTDERLQKIRIEPADDFYDTTRIWDWSDHILADTALDSADRAPEIHETRSWGYIDGDGAVTRYNAENDTEFGRWSHTSTSKAAKEGEDVTLNPLFSPTLSETDVYANAPSARILRVGDRDDAEADDATAFTPRIVRYAGMHNLPTGERWGYPLQEERYPLAAFHFAGDAQTEGFTLCFEDRDGAEGLHRYRDTQLEADDTRQCLSLRLKILPEEFAALGRLDDTGHPSLRSCFRFRFAGGESLYTLTAIEAYNPRTGIAEALFNRLSKD